MSHIFLHCSHSNRLFCQLLKQFLPVDQFTFQEVDQKITQPPIQPAVLLVEFGLPKRRALEIIRCYRDQSKSKIVLLMPSGPQTDHERQLLLDCVEVGVDGFILEESGLDELTFALHQVSEGHVVCPPRLMRPFMEEFASLCREDRLRRNVKPSILTKREVEILQWIAEGLSNRLIAEKLSLSHFTVKNHVHRILKKLGVQDRFEAVQFAAEQQLLTSPPPGLRPRQHVI